MLKRESRQYELTRIALATVRSFSRWRKTKLGELWNSSSLAINWGQHSVSGYLTTLRSLWWLQFIAIGRERSEFERRIMIHKTGWVTGGRATWLLPWRHLWRSLDMRSTVSRDVVKRMNTRRTTVMVQRRWESYPRDRWARGGGTAASRSGVKLNGGADPSTRNVIHLPRARI
jgi:hypothetical protein